MRAVISGIFLFSCSSAAVACTGVFVDWGDAPAPYDQTASHDSDTDNPPIRLGTLFDCEPGPQPHSVALGDDVDMPPADPTDVDDEDGVVFLSGAFIPGVQADVEVTMTLVGVTGYLSAWCDFNDDGVWTDSDLPTGERIADALPYASSGTQTLQFTAPAGMAQFEDIFCRFRAHNNMGGLAPTGGPENSGEVEDHLIQSLPIDLMEFSVD